MKYTFAICFFLMITNQVYAQNETYEVFNTSINSKFAELGISYLNDSTVVYASSKKTANDKSFVVDRRRNNRQLYVDLYSGKIKNGDIVNEQKFTHEVDNKFYVSDISFTNDKKSVFFTWNNFYSTTSRKDSAKWKTLHIVKASINEKLEITSIEHLPFNSEDYSVRSPELSKDESQLFFISDMPGGYGNTDIYVVDIFENGTYSEPRNLGPNVNTKLPEMFPHSAKNGQIYFSSYGHNSTGGLDIFKSSFVNDEYEKAEKLPSPINTRVDDFAFVINEANNTGFFSSTRKKGKGDADIYSFIRIPAEIKCSKEISGNVLNINSKEQLPNVNIQLIVEGEIKDEITTGNDGFYSFKLDCDLDYTLEIAKQFYEDSIVNFSTNEAFEDEKIENILLTPINCSQTLNLEVVNRETGKVLENSTLKIFKNNEELNLQETSNLKIDCNSQYKIIAEKSGFISNTIVFNSSKEYNETVTKKITLTPIKCYQNFTGTIVDKTTKQELNNLKVYLIADNEVIDEIDLNSYKLNFTLDCDKNYTIKVEKTNYKTSEIHISTSSELKKVIFETIELEPIECVQTINVTVVDDSKQLLSGANIELFKNEELVSSSLSNNADLFLNLDCENEYKIVVLKDNYITNEYKFRTTKQYDLKLTKEIVLVEKECNQTISGIISDSENSTIIPNTKVQLFTNNNLVGSTFSNEKGEYQFQINCNSDYKIVVEKTDFISKEIEFSTNGTFNNVQTKDILIDPLKCNQTIDVTVVDSKTKIPLTNTQIAIFEGDKLLETNVYKGETSFNLVCKTSYKIVVSKENYSTQEFIFNTNNDHLNNLTKTIELAQKECKQTISGIVSDAENETIIPNTKVQLFTNNNLVGSTFSNEKGEYQFQINCNSDYKIVVEKTDFISKEIEFSTNGTFNDVQTKDILIDPLKCNQTIDVTVIDSTTKATLTNTQIAIFEDDKLLETNVYKGETSFNLVCKTSYKIVVSKDNYTTQEFIFNTNNNHLNNLTKTIELVQKECKQTISGIVSDAENETIIPNTKVQLFTNNNLVGSTFSNEKGEYQFQIKCNSDYKIVVEKTDYKTEEIIVNSTNEFNASVTKNIAITLIPCNQTITGTVLNDKNQEVIPNAVVKLFLNGNLVASKTTETDGTYDFNIECNKNYKVTGQHENYDFTETSLTSDKLADKINNRNIELTPKICTQELDIIIVNEDTNEQLNNLKFTLSKDGKIVESISLKTKTFILNIDCNSAYKITISKENYEPKEVEFKSNSDYYKKYSEIIKLKPLPCKQYISGKIIDRKLNIPIQNASLEVYSNNKLISSHTADSNGNFKIELNCNLDYSIVTSANDYLNDLKIINTNNQYNKEFNIDIFLNDKESELFEEVENVKTVKMNPINFALNESKITILIAKELDKLIETLTKYPNLNLEIKNHTDSRAPDDYNLKLSEDRAQSIVNYIIARGIDNSRVIGKGYGETELLNKCANGIKCSEAEHQINRRTEFIVKEKE